MSRFEGEVKIVSRTISNRRELELEQRLKALEEHAVESKTMMSFLNSKVNDLYSQQGTSAIMIKTPPSYGKLKKMQSEKEKSVASKEKRTKGLFSAHQSLDKKQEQMAIGTTSAKKRLEKKNSRSSHKEMSSSLVETRINIQRRLFIITFIFFVVGFVSVALEPLFGGVILFIGLANVFLSLYTLWQKTGELIINPKFILFGTIGSLWLAILSLIGLFFVG